MDLVDVMERVLQKLPDASIHGYADGRAHLSIPLDAHKASQRDRVRAELRRLSSNPAFGNR